MSSLVDLLKDIEEIDVTVSEDLTRFSTLKLKASGDLITVKSISGLQAVLKTLSASSINPVILGAGSNTLLPPKNERPYLKLDIPFSREDFEGLKDEYVIPASAPLHLLTSHAMKHGLLGWEVFTGVPATLGGAVAMNAGTSLGEICEIVKLVQIVSKEGEFRDHIPTKDSFSYRHNTFLKSGDVIFSVTLGHKGLDNSLGARIKDYMEFRKRTQPLNMPTCGCTFRNKKDSSTNELICRAGETLDKMGMKGRVYGDLRVSPVHANFIENLGNATYDEFLEFLRIIQNEVREQYGFEFEVEIKTALD